MSDEAVLRTLHVDDLIELVEVLRRDYAAAVADRDRLRAVVDAVRVAADAGSVVGVLAALHQLDVSPDTGGDPDD